MPPAPPRPAEPERVISFEEKFGTRWTVWIGGVALALGGIFLVKYSIEAGLIGPGLRLFFGALLAARLVVGGEWARRQKQLAGFAALPAADIPSILTAAGTTVAYATVYAAYGLYGFLDPAFAFVLLGAVALATLGAALLHGPALAALGLVGAFVTPLLVASTAPNYWALYIYLAVVTAAAFALALVRLWQWLALIAVAFGFFWLLPGITDSGVDALAAHLFHVAVGYALSAALIVAGLFYGPSSEPGKIDPLSVIVLSVYGVGALILVLASRHDPAALTIFTVLTIATVAIAWRTDAAAGAVPVAAVLASIVILRWALAPEIAHLIAGPGAAGAAAPQPWNADIGPHIALGLLFAVLFGAGGFLAQGRSPSPLIPILWSAAGIATPLLILIALYYRIAGFERSIPFAGLALLLAALNGFATEELGKRAPRPGLAASGALYATGTVAALALALTFALEKGWLTVALALMVPGIAWIANERPFPMLRWLAAAAVVLVVARVGWEPRIVGSDVGTTPIFNWILYGYGVPAISFWVAGHLLRKRADDQPSRMVDSAAILFTVLTAFLEIRHFMNGGDIYRHTSALGELALQVCTGLAMTIGLEHVRHRTGSVVHDIGALVIAALTFGAIVLGFLDDLQSAVHRRAGRRRLHQSHPAGLRHPGGARHRAGDANARRAPAGLSHRRGRHRGAADAELSLARGAHALSRAGAEPRPRHHRRRAIHLFGGLARLRRGAAAVRHRVPLAAGAACVRRHHAAHRRQGVPGRYVRPDRRLSRAVLHRARPGAGRHRLALSAAAVSAAPKHKRRPV